MKSNPQPFTQSFKKIFYCGKSFFLPSLMRESYCFLASGNGRAEAGTKKAVGQKSFRLQASNIKRFNVTLEL